MAMIVIGLGLGLSMQVYTLVVQNVVAQRELGVATAAIQFFRNIGSTIGTAVLGTVMTASMSSSISAANRSDPAREYGRARGVRRAVDISGLESAALDPSALYKLPEFLVEPIRMGMGDAMHMVFLTALPFVVIALVLSLFIKQVPLRETLDTVDETPAQQGSDAAAEFAGTGSESQERTRTPVSWRPWAPPARHRPATTMATTTAAAGAATTATAGTTAAATATTWRSPPTADPPAGPVERPGSGSRALGAAPTDPPVGVPLSLSRSDARYSSVPGGSRR